MKINRSRSRTNVQVRDTSIIKLLPPHKQMVGDVDCNCSSFREMGLICFLANGTSEILGKENIIPLYIFKLSSNGIHCTGTQMDK